jgi:formate dehydrogenase major subunit
VAPAVFNTVVVEHLGQAGSIPVRLRQTRVQPTCPGRNIHHTSEGSCMGARTWLGEWPMFRQATGSDPLGRGSAVQSARTQALGPRTSDADEVVKSVCPYCAVGCGQNVYVRDGRVTQIEGDPDSPVSRGRLCPKGSASTSLVTSPSRVTTVRYRRPYGTEWEDLVLRRTLGFSSLGGATLDNEENYLIKKLFMALGAIQVENQARI